jgi:glycine oxidase
VTAPDVVVVGAGVIGAACAYELAGARLRVTVIERAEPGAEASGASAGMLSAFSTARPASIDPLCRLSRDLYAPLGETLRAESGVDIEHERAGHIQLCMSEEEVRWARKLVAEHADGSERLEFLTAEDLQRIEPELTREALGGLRMPRNEWVNNERLVAALFRAATRRGVRFILGQPVEALEHAQGRVTGVRARGLGSVPTRSVVLAAGAWCGDIAGVPTALRLQPVKGQMLALSNTPPLFHHAVLRDDIYLIPRSSGECLIGSTVEEGVADKTVTPAALHWLLTEALITVPGLARVPFRRAWAGLRPATTDGLPVVGPWPDLAGLVVATGHFRNGILLAPVTARIVREWIVDGRSKLPAEPLLPDRLVR